MFKVTIIGIYNSNPIFDPFWDQVPFVLPYWRQFDFTNIAIAYYYYAVALWITFFGLFGITGNGVVIWIFLRLEYSVHCCIASITNITNVLAYILPNRKKN